MKKLIIVLIMVLSSLMSYSQDKTLFDRINGITTNGDIYIKWNPEKKQLEYNISDGKDKDKQTVVVDDDFLVNIKNKYRNTYKVFFEFYNPLQYSVKADIKELDDPAYQAINDFISKLPDASPVELLANAADRMITIQSFTPNKFNSLMNFDFLTPLELPQSVILYDWIYEFSTLVNLDSIAKDEKKLKLYNDLVNDLKKALPVDYFLYGK